jgi:hydrogenase-4 component E
MVDGRLVTTLSELLVAAGVLATVLRHLRHGVFALVVQGLCLAAIAIAFNHTLAGLASGALVLTAKAFVVPWLLWRTVRENRALEASESVSGWVYPGIVAALLAVHAIDHQLAPAFGAAGPLLLPSGLVVTLLGLVAIAARSLLPSQMLGLALTENGIYATGLALTRGLPPVLDLAIVLDLLLALVLLAWLTGRVHAVWGHLDAEQLDRLRG